MIPAATLTPDALAVLNTSRSLPLLAVVSVNFAVLVTTWETRYRTRRALQTLEPWQLDDVGLTPRTARMEASKVFWRA